MALVSDCVPAMHGAKITAWGHACQPKQVFKGGALIFFLACEESRLQMKHAKKLLYQILNMKNTILDTHGIIKHLYNFNQTQNQLVETQTQLSHKMTKEDFYSNILKLGINNS